MKKINLEEIFISSLGSDHMLKWYLQHEINIVNYLDDTKKPFMAFLDITMALISKKIKIEIVGDLSAERILKIFKKKRPELYEVLIKHPKGMSWLEKQIKNFKERFL